MTVTIYSGEKMLEADAEPLRPVMIHRALLGSIERFTAVATEHFAGKWQACILSDPSHDR